MDSIIKLFAENSAIFYSLLTCLGFIFCDTLLGYAKAWKEGNFDLSLAPKFLVSNIFPYIGALIILALFSLFIEDMISLFYIAVGLVMVKFGKEIITEKIKALFN